MADSLEASQLSAALDAALAEQARPQRRPGTDVATNLLYRRYRSRRLSEDQSRRFFDQMFSMGLAVRSPIVAGQPAPAAITREYRGPAGGFTGEHYQSRIKVRKVEVDGKRASSDEDTDTALASSPQADLRISEVGKHTVEVLVDFQITQHESDPRIWLEEAEADFSGQRSLCAALEVIRTEPPDLFRMRYSDELDRAVARSVQVIETQVTDSSRPPSGGFTLCWGNTPPIGLASDVFAEINGQRVPVSQRALNHNGMSMELLRPGKLPARANIILRASKSAALRTPDLFEIWDGELWFDDVPVVPPFKSGPAAQPVHLARVRRIDPAEQFPPVEPAKWHDRSYNWPIDEPE